jgi:hypothetical protein
MKVRSNPLKLCAGGVCPTLTGCPAAGYPTKPPVSYQIKPTTVWVAPSSTGVPRRRGALKTMGLRNEPLGVKPPSDDLATVIVLPSVVDTRVATSCNQIGAGEPI